MGPPWLRNLGWGKWFSPGLGSPAESLLGAIVDTTDDAIVTCDETLRVRIWSPAAVLLFGRPSEEASGVHFTDIFPEHLRSGVAALLARALAGHQTRRFETEVVRADGMPMPVSISCSPIFGSGGSIGGVVVLARDLTEQRLAQATLAEIEARLQAGEAMSHTGSWLLDFRTGVVQWTTEFHRIHGVDPLDFGGTVESYLETIHPEDRAALSDAIEKAASSARPFEAEYRVWSKEPERTRRVQVRAEPAIGSDGRVVGLRGIGQEVV